MSRFDNWPWRVWATERAKATALIHDQQCYSWLQLVQQIDRQATVLAAAGVAKQHGVALRGKNSLELLINYLAALQLGARVLPLNPQLPQHLVTELLPRLAIQFGWSLETTDWPSRITAISADSAMSAVAEEEKANDCWLAERLATMTLTSGSSGLPKAAVHTLQAHLDNAESLLTKMDFQAEDRWLLSLPLFHISGQAIIWRWMERGAVLVLRSMTDLTQALAGCTHASLVPTQLWRLLSQTTDRLSLKQVLLGGAMIPNELTEQAAARGIRCWCGYGLTEMASTVCAKPADSRPGVGLALPYRHIQIVNEEIWLKGSGLASGYWSGNTVTPLVDEQGWLHTRDRGEFRQQELVILGRLDNQFFSGGEGIQPEDIERVLAGHPLVASVLVVPVESAEFGQRPVAVLETTESFDITTLRQWLVGKIANYQLPDAYYLLPETLRQGGIKVSRKAVCDWANRRHQET